MDDGDRQPVPHKIRKVISPSGSEAGRRSRRLTVVLILISVWAAAASAGWAWSASQAAAELQKRAWASGAILIEEIRWDLEQANFSTIGFLETGQVGSGWAAYLSLAGAAQDTHDAAFNSTGYPVAASLNLTEHNLNCALAGYRDVFQEVRTNASLLNDSFHQTYFTSAARLYSEAGKTLQPVWPNGVDPAVQLGPAGTKEVQGLMGQLEALNSFESTCDP